MNVSHGATSVLLMSSPKDDEELARITPVHLRRGDDMCRRRLAARSTAESGMRTGPPTCGSRCRTASKRRAPRAIGARRASNRAFVEPHELEPEQRALYRAVTRGYLDAFGGVIAQFARLDFRTALPDLGVELSSNLGLAAELPGGGRELRKILVGAPRSARLVDAVETRVALVRTEEWAPVQLDIVVVDVIEQRRADHTPDLEADRAEAHAWIGDRVERVLELASDPRPRAGCDCQGCAFISGCAKHPG